MEAALDWVEVEEGEAEAMDIVIVTVMDTVLKSREEQEGVDQAEEMMIPTRKDLETRTTFTTKMRNPRPTIIMVSK